LEHKSYGRLSKRLDKPQIDQIMLNFKDSFGNLNRVLTILKKSDIAYKRDNMIEEIYNLTNTAEEIIFEMKRIDPLCSQRADEILMSLRTIRANLLNFKANKHKADNREDDKIILPEEMMVD
jgi:hypothetical protein